MNNIWKKYNQYLIGMMIIIGFWIFVQFGILGIISQIEDKSNLIEEKSLDRENQQKRIEQLPELRAQFSAISEKENELRVLVRKEEELDLIKMIEKIAEDTGNKITIEIKENNPENAGKKNKEADKNIKEEDAIKPANEKYLSVEVSLAGTYNGLLNFINKIENMKYWSDILSIESNLAESSLSSRNGDIFTAGRVTEEKISGEEKPKKELESKVSIIFYQE